MTTQNKKKTSVLKRRRRFSSAVSARNKRRRPGAKASLWPVLYSDIVLLSIVFATLSFVYLDQMAAERRKLADPAILDFFQMITDIGKSEWILIPSGLLCLLLVFVDWQGLARRQQVWLSGLLFDAWFLFLTIAGSGIIVLTLKQLAGRARPKHLETLGIDYFDPMRFEASFTSFPSGHSVTIAAVATVLVLRLPKFKAVLVILALLIGLSRVMVGAHYPSDVIIGLTLGALFTLFLARMFATKNIGFRVRRNGPIETGLPIRRILRGASPMKLKDMFSLAKRLVGFSS